MGNGNSRLSYLGLFVLPGNIREAKARVHCSNVRSVPAVMIAVAAVRIYRGNGG
jgi:hypothetical protein